ncbi:MAG: GNAT family N-acetyltransferase [Gaiellaceae bacterium]
MGAIRDATWDDFDVVFELLDARSRAAFGVSEQKPEFLRQRWELPGAEKWVALAGAQVTGYASIDEEQHLVLAAVEPDVGDALLAHAEQRARGRGFDHLAATAVPEDAPFWALLQRSGFSHDREVLRMWRTLNGSLPEPVWPHGVTVRTYSRADDGAVHALLDDAYAGWDRDYVAQSHEGWLSFMTGHDEFDQELWFLAERDGDLVACALHWKEQQRRGWVKDIVVRESERGHGLGKALLRHGFAAYAARGVERVGLKVDSTNPTGAPQLYEREGFVVDQQLGMWHKRL